VNVLWTKPDICRLLARQFSLGEHVPSGSPCRPGGNAAFSYEVLRGLS
jgi:hypothetical protein